MGGIGELHSWHTQQESFEPFGDVEKKNHFFSDKWHSRKLKEILGILGVYMLKASTRAVGYAEAAIDQKGNCAPTQPPKEAG